MTNGVLSKRAKAFAGKPMPANVAVTALNENLYTALLPADTRTGSS